LTAQNRAWDGTPRYSPDGRYIAFRAQRTPGYESDRFELRVLERASGAVRTLTEGFDDWVEDYDWAPDGRGLYCTATVRARARLWGGAGREGAARGDGGAERERSAGAGRRLGPVRAQRAVAAGRDRAPAARGGGRGGGGRACDARERRAVRDGGDGRGAR